MRAEARAHFIHVEKELLGGDHSLDLPRFLAKAAYILRLYFVGADDFQLRHGNLLDRIRGILLHPGLPNAKYRLALDGLEAVANTPEEFAPQVKADTAKWTRW
jgi:hypothetical protein